MKTTTQEKGRARSALEVVLAHSQDELYRARRELGSAERAYIHERDHSDPDERAVEAALLVVGHRRREHQVAVRAEAQAREAAAKERARRP